MCLNHRFILTTFIFFAASLFLHAQEEKKIRDDGEDNKLIILHHRAIDQKHEQAVIEPTRVLDNTIDVGIIPGESVQRESVYIGAGRFEKYYDEDVEKKPWFLDYQTNAVYRRYSNINPVGSMYVDFTLSADKNAPTGDHQFFVEFAFHNGGSPAVTYTLTINVLIVKQEVVFAPDKPTGPDNGKVGQRLTFDTDGAYSIFGHDVEYQYDWGDNTLSDWEWSGYENHSFDSPGTKNVRARARCEIHTDIVSDWSDAISVIITYYNLTIRIEPAGAGEVSKNPDKEGYSYNESVDLTATENSGYEFEKWSGNASGTNRTTTIRMNIDKDITANFIQIPAPVADFEATPTSGILPLDVQFNDQSSGDISSYFWEFGDGQTSSAQNPSHTYQDEGTYTVKLTVTGPGGSNSETKTDYIQVDKIPEPVADFSASPTSGIIPLTVQFTDQSSGNITSRSWNFGDGETSTTINPSHVYQDTGSFTVQLTVTGPGGTNTKTDTGYIRVNEPDLYPPTLIFPTDKTSNIKTDPSFSWNSEDKADSYELQVSESISFNPTVIDVKQITQTSYEGKGLKLGTNYNWRARCVNDSATSSWSEIWRFKTETELRSPTLISPQNEETNVSTSPMLIWENPSGTASSQLQLSKSNNFETIEKNTLNSPSSTSYQLINLLEGTEFYWRLRGFSAANDTSSWCRVWKFTTEGVTSVDIAQSETPIEFSLLQNYPNPFNPETEIKFELPEDGHIQIKILNTKGQDIRNLANSYYQSGYHKILWDGRNKNGHTVASGIYLYYLKTSSFFQIKKMTLIR